MSVLTLRSESNRSTDIDVRRECQWGHWNLCVLSAFSYY